MITSISMDKNYLTEISNGEEGVAKIYADIPQDQGGEGKNMRPGEILLSGWAACMNITARKYLNRDNIKFDKVVVKVDINKDEEGISKFYSKIEIFADVPQEVKDRIIEEVKDCPVCDTLKRTAQLLDLEQY